MDRLNVNQLVLFYLSTDIRRNETNFPVLRLLGHRVAEQHEALQPRAEEQEADGVVVVYEVAAKRAGDIL